MRKLKALFTQKYSLYKHYRGNSLRLIYIIILTGEIVIIVTVLYITRTTSSLQYLTNVYFEKAKMVQPGMQTNKYSHTMKA
tara:strand:- start:47 stop:289 length:243 start_codon:yes stop_codon:yes gene_type:complete